jgi:predicted nucleotidyltransferase
MDILDTIQQKKEELVQRFGVRRIGIVSSHGGRRQEEVSKVNLLIEFGEVTIDVFLSLMSFLEELLGRSVDLARFKEPTSRIHSFTDREISWWD